MDKTPDEILGQIDQHLEEKWNRMREMETLMFGEPGVARTRVNQFMSRDSIDGVKIGSVGSGRSYGSNIEWTMREIGSAYYDLFEDSSLPASVRILNPRLQK